MPVVMQIICRFMYTGITRLESKLEKLEYAKKKN